ncbi:MAG: hypothetical protein M9916_07380 [Crocinitomicaceae bacterium]|nr:hypothetical protein [Crocinitomicaceae bacterium]
MKSFQKFFSSFPCAITISYFPLGLREIDFISGDVSSVDPILLSPQGIRVDGKVKEIRRSLSSNKKNLIFDYNAFGQRIAKHQYNRQTLMLEKSTYYILDAQGNQMSMYEHQVTPANNATRYYLTERNIYGSDRLGTTHDSNMFIPTNSSMRVFGTEITNSTTTLAMV